MSVVDRDWGVRDIYEKCLLFAVRVVSEAGVLKKTRTTINNNRDFIILILSIICYFILFFNWNRLETINPPIETRIIIISEVLYIDLIGVLLPLFLSSLFSYYIFHNNIISFKKYINMLSIITSIILFSNAIISSNIGAIMIQWLFVILLSSLMSILSLYSLYNLKNTPISYRNTINIYIIGFCYSTHSLILIDMIYAIFSSYTYIGAAGIVDAIFLSSIFVFVPTLFWVSLFNILRAREICV